MKKRISLLLTICLAFSLTGCFGPKDVLPDASETISAGTQPTTDTTQPATTPTEPETEETMLAISVPAVTDNTTASDGTVLFQYTYQNLSLVLHKPAVADKVILDLINRIDSTQAEAQGVADMAKSAYNGNQNWVPYLYHLAYSPTRIDQRVLSLFGNKVVYSGAAHPDRFGISASYDLTTGDVLTLASIMTKDAKTDDFCNLVLEGLYGRAEGDYLYENYAQTVKQRFTSDASKDEAWYFTTTGLCFYFAPYEIAPYTSGVITVEIPYEKLQGLLYSAYFPAQRKEAAGSITISPFAEVDTDKFSDIAELVADNGGKMYMIYTDSQVQNIQITQNDSAGSYTIFAANTLSADDAIMIQANDDILRDIEITYRSNGEMIKTQVIK